MELERVVFIVEALAAGIDPTNGREIPSGVFQTPEVIRALFIAANALRSGGPGGGGSASAPALRGARPAAAGVRWTDEEDGVLSREFDEGVTLSDLARRHNRTTGAITARLVKLGKVDAESVRVRDRSALAVS